MKNKIILAGLISFLLVSPLVFAEAAQGKINVDQNPGVREMVMPDDKCLAFHDLEDYYCELKTGGEASEMEKVIALDAFVNARATDPTNSDGDGYGDSRSYPIREGGHTVKPGQRQEFSGSPIVIELPMSKGTVKFFNETKSIDVTINTPTKIVRVVREIKK